MGTDINIYIEKWTPEQGWKYIGGDDDILGEFLPRNYFLYGILANEEKDYRWHNETTTIGSIPIAPARGIPKDADPDEDYKDTPFEKAEHSRWFPSWVTLQEILDYPHWDTHIIVEIGASVGEKYRDVCRVFVDEFVPKLQKLADDPKHLRLILEFW